jgi:hypothetical protein
MQLVEELNDLAGLHLRLLCRLELGLCSIALYLGAELLPALCAFDHDENEFPLPCCWTSCYLIKDHYSAA